MAEKHDPSKRAKASEVQSSPDGLRDPDRLQCRIAELLRRFEDLGASTARDSLGSSVSSVLLSKWLTQDTGESLRQHLARTLESETQRRRELESKIGELKAEVDAKTKALLDATNTREQQETRVQELKEAIDELREKESLNHLLNRVGPEGQTRLLESPEFRKLFEPAGPCDAYILSIDIRRSTELMLKARAPKLFATFIIDLARQLRQVILDRYGVFDKFTGDGILAFFPDFYSGEDAGYLAVQAASECHQVFAKHYAAHRHCFMSVLMDTGLGIGLDFGQVQVVHVGSDLTVVGAPVVYACRMGGAEARHTYLNEPAFERLFGQYSAYCDYSDVFLDFKHEGRTLAHDVVMNGKPYTPKRPPWLGAAAPGATAPQ